MTPLSRRTFLAATGSAAAAAAAQAAGAVASASKTAVHSTVKALTFDILGTTVDFRASLIREGQLLTKRKGVKADWARLTDEWRAGYRPALNRIINGEAPWADLDHINRRILDELVAKMDIRGLTESDLAELNRAWHRLMPWPDAVTGLTRLRTRYITATLSNGHVAMLVNLVKNAGLPFDCVLSAEMSGRYKPDPAVFETAAKLLGLPLGEVMMVAAHQNDLIAARKLEMKTAFVRRPLEFGTERDAEKPPEVDLVADDFIDLAQQLGA